MVDSTGFSTANEKAAKRALDNYAKSSRKRLDRWEARGFLWTFSENKRCRKCGRVTVTPDGSVGIRANGQSVGFAGLATCGSVWVCPVCNARIQAVRRLEVGVALATVFARGGGAGFGANTVRHHKGQPLSVVLDALTYGTARIARDKSVAQLRKDLGYFGRIKALEVTHGANGFHPHNHPLPLFRVPPTALQLDALHRAEFRAFRAGVERRGMVAPLEEAQTLKPVRPGTSETLGDYFAKSTYTHDAAAFEMTSTQSKLGKKSGRTPWQILDSARLLGDADDLAIWNEYERTMKGKRALTFSRGLRDELGLSAEASDEEIADEEVGDATDTGFKVIDWTPVQRNARLGAQLLNVVTPAGNWQAGRDFCRENGIETEEIQ
jgi:hypothetical protein